MERDLKEALGKIVKRERKTYKSDWEEESKKVKKIGQGVDKTKDRGSRIKKESKNSMKFVETEGMWHRGGKNQ